MAGKLMDEGEARFLEILLGTRNPDGALYLGLYKTPITEPDETTVLTDLVEPSGYGYSRKTLTRGQWVLNGSAAAYALQTFLASGGDWGEVAGYFIATSSDHSGKLIALEHFASALQVLDGKGIKVSPQITSS
ncbi:MAG: hypothetical protein ACOZF2_11270 [Thermodesulfobacteriota bacterium]